VPAGSSAALVVLARPTNVKATVAATKIFISGIPRFNNRQQPPITLKRRQNCPLYRILTTVALLLVLSLRYPIRRHGLPFTSTFRLAGDRVAFNCAAVLRRALLAVELARDREADLVVLKRAIGNLRGRATIPSRHRAGQLIAFELQGERLFPLLPAERRRP